MKLIWNVFYFIFPLVADIYHCPTAIIWSYDELSFLIRNSWRRAILNIYIFHVHKTFLGENTPWNISFRAWNTYFTTVSLCKHYREMLMISFLKPYIKYKNFENRFSKFSLSWKTFLLNLFLCLINSFVINNVQRKI